MGCQRSRRRQLRTGQSYPRHDRKGRTSVPSHAADAVGQNHGRRNSKVVPSAKIVARPDTGIQSDSDASARQWLTVQSAANPQRRLGTGQKVASERHLARSRRERSSCAAARINARPDLRSRAHVKHAIEVVQVAVFPTSVMDVVLWHGDFGSVENCRLRGCQPRSQKANRHTSFISFQMNRFGVDPLNLSYLKRPDHQAQLRRLQRTVKPCECPHLAGLKKSTQDEEPVQHQPSYSEPSAFLASRSSSLASLYT
jgi:hypothetical protein